MNEKENEKFEQWRISKDHNAITLLIYDNKKEYCSRDALARAVEKIAFEAGEKVVLELLTEENIYKWASVLSFSRTYMPELFKQNKGKQDNRTKCDY